MAAKRWPYFPQLAERFEDVVIVGTEDDLCHRDGTIMQFPPHARRFVGALTLRETAGYSPVLVLSLAMTADWRILRPQWAHRP
jgi:hypothetical protein